MQFSQVSGETAPSLVECVPALQFKHVKSDLAALTVEYVPAAQSVHVVGPTSALYLPAAHSAHVPPSGPVEPALQVHAVETLLPDGALAFAGHAKQAEL